jgi:hypothetical protein
MHDGPYFYAEGDVWSHQDGDRSIHYRLNSSYEWVCILFVSNYSDMMAYWSEKYSAERVFEVSNIFVASPNWYLSVRERGGGGT